MIKAEKICKTYRHVPVLQGVDLTVEKGEFLSIMGESGNGKSTLLNILAGNLAPDSGRVFLAGKEVTAMGDRELSRLRRTALGFVYQTLNLIPTLTVRDNVLLPLYLDKKPLETYAERMRELCELLGISHLLSAFPDDCSGGERQRAAIARAMLHSPDVLMLDEPTGSLDSRSTENVMELLSRLNREWGVTVVQVTHSAATAAYGSRTVILSEGTLTEQ